MTDVKPWGCLAEKKKVLLLCASTIGLPATVAAFTWMLDGRGGATKRASGKR